MPSVRQKHRRVERAHGFAEILGGACLRASTILFGDALPSSWSPLRSDLPEQPLARLFGRGVV